MKLFSCVCEQVVFFESVACIRCGRALAFVPERGLVQAMDEESASWKVAGDNDGTRYRACRNAREHAVCNWAVPVDDAEEYCRACRLNQMIPDLGVPGAKEAWHRLEVAKRRLLYTLLDLDLPLDGLAFSFLKDDPAAVVKVFTGHSDGLITINVAEADAPFRERMREQLGETCRTLLGHFRHEIGHYYWQRLIDGGARLAEFRARFGDERTDYGAAQQRHYEGGPPPDWPERFVSAYASMHPWEDWAETWAHYLHMVDTLETARAFGLALKPRPADAPSQAPVAVRRLDPRSFDDLMTSWFPLTIAMNGLNRSMGLPDPYPFVLTPPAVEKLRFVHDVCC